MRSSPPFLVVNMLKLALVPAIWFSALGFMVGLPMSFVPILQVFFIPMLAVSIPTFVFALPTLLYLVMAQSDPPPEARLPFISLSPARNFVLSVITCRWGWSAILIWLSLFKQWCHRRVMILGSRRTKEPMASENIPYHNGQTLSVYHPALTPLTSNSPRPIIIIVPSPTSPLPIAFLSLLALRLRLSSYLVIVPSSTFPTYPDANLPSSVTLSRHLLAWTARNASALNGDPEQIYLLGHGTGALVAMMAGGLRDAIVKSRDEWLWKRYTRTREEASVGSGEGSSGSGGDWEDGERDGEMGAQEMEELDGEGADEVPNGLKRVEIFGEEVQIPRVAGVIALSPMTDVPAQIRHEASLHIEHLSSTRRFLGPSQTDTMLASPSHLLYAAKNVLEVEGKLIKKWLIVHGGRDEFIPVTQSSLMRELLVGLGVPNVRFRAYKELNHMDTLFSLMIGTNNSHSEVLLRDIENFTSTH